MTQMDEIMPGLYRISTAMEDGGFTFNQFLIQDEKNTLVHTGALSLFKEVSAKIGQALGTKPLDYIFISHFEADECGALCNILGLHPKAMPVCPAGTARQLQGFGTYRSPMVMKEGDELPLGRRRLQFIDYPSDVHLRPGLLAYETADRVLFSSDLFISREKVEGPVKKADFPNGLEITLQSIPSEEGRQKCQEAVNRLDIALIATGHGPAIDLRP